MPKCSRAALSSGHSLAYSSRGFDIGRSKVHYLVVRQNRGQTYYKNRKEAEQIKFGGMLKDKEAEGREEHVSTIEVGKGKGKGGCGKTVRS